MKRLLIVWHSRTGGSKQMAEAALAGARDETGVVTECLEAEQAQPSDVLRSEGFLFVGPENLAALSGEMKAFFDRCYYPVLGRAEGRPYAHMVCAGSDGTGAVRQLERIVTGWRMKAVHPPLIINTEAQSEAAILAAKTLTEAQLEPCRELGAAMATGIALGVF